MTLLRAFVEFYWATMLCKILKKLEEAVCLLHLNHVIVSQEGGIMNVLIVIFNTHTTTPLITVNHIKIFTLVPPKNFALLFALAQLCPLNG